MLSSEQERLVARIRVKLASIKADLELLRATPPDFTKQQAIADARKKMESYGPMTRHALESLVKDWEGEA